MEAVGILYLLILFAIYFFPTIIAQRRGHHQTLAIGMLNLLAGWTFLGWIGALVWACTEVHRAPRGEPASAL